MPTPQRAWSVTLVASSFALFHCVGDAAAPTSDASTPDVSNGADASDASTAADASDASVEAEAGPPTPTGTLASAFQNRDDGDGDYTPFFTGDVAPPVAFDAAGNVYFAGSFSGTGTFGDPNKVTCTLSTKGGLSDIDGYVAKIDAQGNCVAAARIGGASTEDTVRALAVSPSGTVIAFGQLFKNTGPGTIGWSINGGADVQTTNGAFLVGLKSSDLSFSFAQDMLPQSNATEPRAVAIGPGGTIAVSGSVPFLTSYQFQNGGGMVTSNGTGAGYQGFVAVYQQNGQLAFGRVWTVKTPAPACISTGGGVGYAANGDVIVTGRALGAVSCDFIGNSSALASNPPSDWTTGPIAVDGGTKGSTSYVALRYDSSGVLKSTYTKPFAGSGYARGAFVAPSGDVYALEGYSSTVGLKFGATTIPGGQGTLLLHLSANFSEQGARLLASTDTSAVVVDPFGSVVVGGTSSADIDLGNGKTAMFKGGGADAYVAKFDGTLASCLWLNSYATVANEQGAGLAVAASGQLAFHGSFQGGSLPLNGAITLANKDASGKTYDGFGGTLVP